VKKMREIWQDCLPGLDLSRLVFLDECGINTLMARLIGRCPQGKRLVASSPAAYWQTITLVSAVRLDGAIAPMMLPGSINGDSFAGYVEQFLVSELTRGDVVIMDNLPSHKSQRVTDAIEGAGCTLVYLPPYSPDFNPIENMWSKVKACLRTAGARTFEALIDAVRDALLAVTPEDCDGYFEHCEQPEKRSKADLVAEVFNRHGAGAGRRLRLRRLRRRIRSRGI
jgi:transposase